MPEKINVYPYRREENVTYFYQHPKKRRRGSSGSPGLGMAAGLISPGLLAAAAVGFFLGRAVILGELTPFTAAYAAAAAVVFGRRGLLVILPLGAGLATVDGGYHLAANSVLAAFSFLIVQALPPRYAGRRLVIPVLAGGLTLSIKAVFAAFTGATPYDYINIFFEALLAGVLASACVVSLWAARKIDGVKPLNAEESLCLLVLTAAVIAGTGDLQVWYVTLKGFLSRIAVMLAALAGGAGMGAAAGAVVGIIPGLAYSVTPYLVGAYSFSGVLAGLGRILGKIGIALSFLASNIILSIYFNNFSSMEAVIAETGLACLVFLLIPEGLVSRFTAVIAGEQAAARPDGSLELYKSALKEKLKSYSAIFTELSRVFGETTAVAGHRDDEQGIKQLLSEIAGKVCVGCGLSHVCWEKEYYRTYQNMLDLFSFAEMYGRVTPADLPDELKLRCTRPREMAITGACLYEAFKVDRYWRKRLIAGRSVVGDQLRGVSAVINALAEGFDFTPRDPGGMDSAVKKKLRQMGLPVKTVKVNDCGGRKEISISMKACQGELDCRYMVAPIVSEYMGQLFSATGCVCGGHLSEGICRFMLYQGPQYRVDVGAAVAGKDGNPVSGDMYSFMQMNGGRFAAILSDGMGSGESAARESSSLVALVKRMLEAGLDMETAIKSVNSVLALKNPAESFATLDMSVINLYSGQAEFVKVAAPPTFLVRGGKVRSLEAKSLPVGILSDIDINVIEKRLASRDVIVMLTDGILEAGRGDRDGEDWIVRILEELSGLDPMEMAELLLKLAQTGSGGELRTPDDMTVVVIRLDKEKVVEMQFDQ